MFYPSSCCRCWPSGRLQEPENFWIAHKVRKSPHSEYESMLFLYDRVPAYLLVDLLHFLYYPGTFSVSDVLTGLPETQVLRCERRDGQGGVGYGWSSMKPFRAWLDCGKPWLVAIFHTLCLHWWTKTSHALYLTLTRILSSLPLPLSWPRHGVNINLSISHQWDWNI